MTDFNKKKILFLKHQLHKIPISSATETPRKITLTNIYRQAAKNSDIRYYLAAILENLCCFMATICRYSVFIFDKRYKFIGKMLPTG